MKQKISFSLLMVLLPAFLGMSSAQATEAKETSVPESPAVKSTDSARSTAFNLRFAPLGFIFGSYSLNFDFAVGDRITVGPYLNYFNYNLLGLGISSVGGGVAMMYYLSGPRLSSSWYLSPEVGFGANSLSLNGATSSVAGLQARATVGYQWVWRSGFNLQLGAGVQYSSMSATQKVGGQETQVTGGAVGVGPAFDFMLGQAF